MISLIIPAYNEAERLPETLASIFNFLKKENLEAEVIVVNDGSTDQTEEVARNNGAGYQKFKLINHSQNKGKGAAVKTGVMQAQGDYIVFLDADNSTPIKELKPLLKNLENYDVVIGSRKIKGAKITQPQSWLRRFLGDGLNWFIKIVLDLPVYNDTQCGFKGFKKYAAKDIFSKMQITGFAFDIELLCVANSLNFKVLEMPIEWHNVQKSKVKLKSIWRIFLDVLRIKLNSLKGIYGKNKIINQKFGIDLLIGIILSEVAVGLLFLVSQNLLKINQGSNVFIGSLIIVFLIMLIGNILSQRAYEFIKFLIVGLLNTAIDFWVLNYLTSFFKIFSGPWLVLFNLTSFFIAVLNSYIFNKFWTFKASGQKWAVEFLNFLVVSVISAAFNTGIVFLGMTFFKHWGGDYVWLNFIKLVAIVFSTLINFLGYKFFAFRAS